ncbi:hypothetical protein Cpar_1187 [Chlorobaculum parvum NCIB 8327]|uniref:Uncharacterized protein n=1 Tax=Chlorobaculum parvum (strain DSM 263 / NCIMB 8327) TaxID=517417 RepID=B3QNU0_CHLP8|nr:hypothetical protein [Chlorobaculum parvum]ACF11593.1 hypothetical protein Cpar_1187 [Chlorobaculum parvum NCIB 8327]
MDVSKETIEVLILLLPGFLFLKVVNLRCSLTKYEAHHYIVDALIASLVIYSMAKILNIQVTSTGWKPILSIFTLTIISALTWSEVINRDWISKILHSSDYRLSTHSSIFPVKAIDKFIGKWHLVKFSNGTEIVGVLREFNHKTHEALIEDARMVMKGGKLTPDKAWYYSPSGEQIIYIRTIEED